VSVTDRVMTDPLDRRKVMSDLAGRATLADVPDLDLTIIYEDGDDGWIVASIPEVQGVHSQGRNREEAREMVLSALSDWLRFYFEEHASPPEDVPAEAERESIHLTFAA
jgi:predicted RNase H-like HicB family nuclease